MAKKKRTDYGGGAPPPAAVDPEAQPIGVGRDFKAEAGYWTPGGSGTYQQPARYFSGDQREIAAGLGREDRADLQYRLKALGLIPSKTKLMLSVWDDASANGFKEVLAWANARGLDWRQALEDMEDSAMEFADEDNQPIQTRAATNPLDFRAAGDELAKEGIGRGLTDQEEQQFAARAAAFEAPSLMSDATVDAPGEAGWGKWAEGQVREVDPLKFDARKVARYGSIIAEALRGGAQ